MSKRVLEFEGIRNFRDLGGYPTFDGKSIKWGIVYRSGGFSEATNEDLRKLSALRIRTVFDLRGAEDSLKQPDRLPDKSGIRKIHLPMTTPAMYAWFQNWRLARRSDRSAIDGFILMTKIYKSMAEDCAAQVKSVIDNLLDPDNIPAVFHCSAGKDRAGFVAAILLAALGVPYSEILKDYLLSNPSIDEWFRGLFDGHPNASMLRKFVEARAEFLEMAYQVLALNHGSIEAYIKNEIQTS